MRRWMTGLVLGGALALTACSGSDDDGAATTTASETTTTTVAAPTTTAAVTSAPAPVTTATSPTTAPAPTSVGPSPGFEASAEFCALVTELRERENLVLAMFASDSTPALARQAWDELDGVLAELVATSPALIKADVETTAAGFAEVRQMFERYDYDPQRLLSAAQNDPALAATLEMTDDPELDAARQRIDTFVERACLPAR